MCSHGQCVNTEGGFKCVCDPGYELTRNGKMCVDIDECRSNPCLSGQCTNTEGGFQVLAEETIDLGSKLIMLNYDNLFPVPVQFGFHVRP